MTVYTLCGSTRFPEAFHLMNAHLTLLGHIVISLGVFGHSDQPAGVKHLTADGQADEPNKIMLDQLHFKKIDMCDVIMVINFGGYIGSSLQKEIDYATAQGKRVEYMFPQKEVTQCATV